MARMITRGSLRKSERLEPKPDSLKFTVTRRKPNVTRPKPKVTPPKAKAKVQRRNTEHTSKKLKNKPSARARHERSRKILEKIENVTERYQAETFMYFLWLQNNWSGMSQSNKEKSANLFLKALNEAADLGFMLSTLWRLR